MQFDKKFNNVCEFPDPIDYVGGAVEDLEKKAREFYKEYELFKKEHGLENQYFSTVIHIGTPGSMITEVYYEISDLYLTYLEANDRLPEGVVVERYLLKEQYFYNTPKEWLFRDSMFLAMHQQSEPEMVGNAKKYKSSGFVGVTERIKLSNPSNGLPGMIIDRVLMTYDELKI